MTNPRNDRTATVELIYDKGCPNVEVTRANLGAAFEGLGIRDRWTERETSSPGIPEDLRALGSPTVLVNGRDVAGTTAGDGACCRLYETEAGRPSGAPAPTLIERALVEAGLGERKRPGGWGPWLLVAPGVLVPFLPALACAACWPAYAALLSALGVGFLASAQYLLPVTIAALAVAVAALAWTSRGDRRPLIAGTLGAALVLAGKFAVGSTLANVAGAGLLVAASLWSMSGRKPAAECPSCLPGGESATPEAKGGDTQWRRHFRSAPLVTLVRRWRSRTERFGSAKRGTWCG